MLPYEQCRKMALVSLGGYSLNFAETYSKDGDNGNFYAFACFVILLLLVLCGLL